MLTKKYYKAIANDIRSANIYAHSATVNASERIGAEIMVNALVEMLVLTFRHDNPNFNAELFRDACRK